MALKTHNKKLHADTYCYARFCVCRVAPFYTKTLSAICAGELGVIFPSMKLLTNKEIDEIERALAGC
jgi:hypothetical protein